MTLSRSAARRFQLDFSEPTPSPSGSVNSSSSASSLRSIFDSSTQSSTLTTRPALAEEPVSEKRDKRGRLFRGSKIEDIYSSDPFSPPPSFSSFSTSFSIPSYISSQILHDPSNLDLIVSIPTRVESEWVTNEKGEEIEVETEVREVEEGVWIVESLRKIVVGLQEWVGRLQFECPGDGDGQGEEREGAGMEYCKEMRAQDWMYLCVAHETPPSKPCSALSYISHVLEGSSSLLTSTKYFPSRVTLSSNNQEEEEKMKKLVGTISRRLYRCFAHMYFHHSKLFEELENETWLFRRFVKLNERFGMISNPNDLIVPEFELVDEQEAEDEEEGDGIRLVE
ncbi:uncharacterized protein JCM6883_007245 [Sporobolomyces salmoneus]|uniref:uncharacterized protein n=1 Tax=Sporobolomyces salmoneus TaxID=183962 RepID=UPI00317B7DFD